MSEPSENMKITRNLMDINTELRAEVERLRAALEGIERDCLEVTKDPGILLPEAAAWKAVAHLARAALNGTAEGGPM